MTPFRNLLTEEERQELDARKFREARERQQLRELSNEKLAEKVEYYMKNSFGLSRIAAEYRANPVYDSALWYNILPVVIERLKEGR